MGELNVTFRGMCTVVLQSDRARILMPRNDRPRTARGNERYTIPVYCSYVAIPVDAKPAGVEPDLFCDLPVDHGETFDAGAAKKAGIRMEAVTRRERATRIIPEPTKVRYALYFTNGYEIVIPPLQRTARQTLQYLATPVQPTQPPQRSETSMFWIASLADAAPNMTNVPNLGGNSVPVDQAAAFVDVANGRMQANGLSPLHTFRFLHGAGAFERPIASEVLVTAEAPAKTSVVLVGLSDGHQRVVTFSTATEPLVIVGNEPLDDILGSSSVQSCAEPQYDFELHYQFLPDRGGDKPPVPICTARGGDDHRSPPGAKCGPAFILSSGG